MNRSYRIERNIVFVTKVNGEIVQMPECERLEEVLQLENEIHQIDQWMNEEFEVEKYSAKRNATIFFKVAMLICLIAITIQNFMLPMIDFSILNVFGGVILSILTVSSGQALIGLSSGNKTMFVYLLEEIKRRKLSKIRLLKKEHSNVVLEQEEKAIPTANLQEFRKLVRNNEEAVQKVLLQNSMIEDLKELRRLVCEYQESLTQEPTEPEKQKTIQK